MSVLSASGHLTPAQADEYSTALLGLLGPANPITVLTDTPRLLRQEFELIPADKVSIPEAPGKWSARIVVAHLADSELVGAFRLRMILAHDRPALAPYDQDLWAKRLRYEHTDLEASLERFTVLRRANLTFWASASPAELARVGIHGERGEESIDRMRRLYAGHDLAHLRQLSRIRILLTGQ
jgi:DinB family protein